MRFDKLNDIIGWGVFLIAAIVYLLTIEPTVSFWDCGEYIAIANKLEVGHPPGAPFFMLVARIFMAFVPKEDAALMVNVMSGLCSAFAVLFLYWSITAIARRIAESSEEGMNKPQQWAILASAFVGAVAFTFTDTFWFSAVEGEVYAMSAMFTAAVFWLILKWDRRADEPHNARYIVLIFFIIGLSIGVHLMNILAIPAIALVYYFRKYQFSVQGLLLSLVISGAIIIIFQVVVITGIFEMAGWFERVMVNQVGAPFNLGAAIYFLLLFGLIIYGLYYTQRNMKPLSNLIILSLAVILLGYSSYTMILIRSSADPPIDENNPENLLTLVSYLKREQYGSRPIFYGQYWNAPRVDNEVVGKSYMKGYKVKREGRSKSIVAYQERFDAKNYVEDHPNQNLTIHPAYIEKKPRRQPVFHSKWTVPFQRMYDSRHGNDYKNWIDASKMENVSYEGRRGEKTRKRPQWWQNFDFYFEYQLGWMYWRYFLWNYAGRQNDLQGFAGSMVKGNWLSGIDFIDSQRLGPQKSPPPTVSQNPAYNRFYYLPIVLGLIGFFYQLVRAPKSWGVVLILFIITGIAIVTYLNQPPHEPRERDYTNVGSFWTFAIWIGLGVYALFDAARNIRMPELREILTWGGGPVGGVLVFSLLIDSGKAFSFSLAYLFVVAFLAIGVMYLVGSYVQNRYGHVLAALLIGLPVPYVLAKDGWDDHDRSDRYTARDYAKNYLDSCEKNAILFTNGDNDTFPLWYVQEVEEYRTDVRVVNLSLLNTDWYIDQMSRKAYDSDPVPFAEQDEEVPRKNRVTSRKYRQGNRDRIFLFGGGNGKKKRNQRIADLVNRGRGKIKKKFGTDAFALDKKENIYVDVAAAVDFMMNDANKVKLHPRASTKYAYFPTKRFFIDVPKEKIKKKNIVPEEQEDRIVDKIKWRIGRRQMTKNSMMTMCLLAHFDWERPIYFSVTVGGNASLGLKNYFQLEGLAYRLVPIKGSNNAVSVDGNIHVDKMYKNLMKEFQWGGIPDEEWVYMDDDNRRMTTNMRLQFANLASELNSMGRKDSAKKVLKRSLEVMPERSVPYNRIMVMTSKELFKAGADSAATDVAKTLFDRYEKAISYYTSLPDHYARKKQVRRKTQEARYVLRSLTSLVSRFGSKKLEKDFKDRAKPYMRKRRKPDATPGTRRRRGPGGGS